MRIDSRVGGRDPLRCSVGGGDSTVEARRDLGHEVGTAGAAVVEVRREQPGRGGRAFADLDRDTRGAEPCDARAGHAPIGVLDRDDDAPHARGDEGVGTGSGAPVMGAGLERDVRGRAVRPITGRVQRFDLGVGAARRLRRALADNDTVPHENTAHPGVRRGAPAGGGRERQRPIHRRTCRPVPGVVVRRAVVRRVVVRRGVGHDPSVQRPGRRQETTTAPTRRSRDGGGDRGPLPSGL